MSTANANALTALTLPQGCSLTVDENETGSNLALDGQPLIQLLLAHGPQVRVQVLAFHQRPIGTSIWIACYWLFARNRACRHLIWHLDQRPEEALLSGLLRCTERAGEYRCERRGFGQLPSPLLGDKMAGWLSALVHSLVLDSHEGAASAAADGTLSGHRHNRCFHCEKEFDFSHKRAALMILGRNRGALSASLRDPVEEGMRISGERGCRRGCPTPCDSAPARHES